MLVWIPSPAELFCEAKFSAFVENAQKNQLFCVVERMRRGKTSKPYVIITFYSGRTIVSTDSTIYNTDDKDRFHQLEIACLAIKSFLRDKVSPAPPNEFNRGKFQPYVEPVKIDKAAKREQKRENDLADLEKFCSNVLTGKGNKQQLRASSPEPGPKMREWDVESMVNFLAKL